MLDQDSFVKRFPNVIEIERYMNNNIQALAVQWFASKNMTCDLEVPLSIAQRSLGIPRIAVQLCSKIRVNALSDGRKHATIKDCNKMYNLLSVDTIGLGRSHRRYLQILSDFIKPQGISTIAGKLGQNPDVVESTVEPVLLSLGFIERTARGRAITPKGNAHIQKDIVRV
jgi:Holliday junction resolvasome, helicase subunit